DEALHTPGRKLYWKVSDLLRRDYSADATDNELFIAGIDDPAAGVLDVFTDDFGQIVHGQAGIAQLGDMWLHDNLLHVTAIGVDLGDAGHRSQLRFDHVFLYLPQLHELGVAGCWRIRRARCVIDRVVEYLAEPSGNWNELR